MCVFFFVTVSVCVLARGAPVCVCAGERRRDVTGDGAGAAGLARGGGLRWRLVLRLLVEHALQRAQHRHAVREHAVRQQERVQEVHRQEPQI